MSDDEMRDDAASDNAAGDGEKTPKNAKRRGDDVLQDRKDATPSRTGAHAQTKYSRSEEDGGDDAGPRNLSPTKGGLATALPNTSAGVPASSQHNVQAPPPPPQQQQQPAAFYQPPPPPPQPPQTFQRDREPEPYSVKFASSASTPASSQVASNCFFDASRSRTYAQRIDNFAKGVVDGNGVVVFMDSEFPGRTAEGRGISVNLVHSLAGGMAPLALFQVAVHVVDMRGLVLQKTVMHKECIPSLLDNFSPLMLVIARQHLRKCLLELADVVDFPLADTRLEAVFAVASQIFSKARRLADADHCIVKAGVRHVILDNNDAPIHLYAELKRILEEADALAGHKTFLGAWANFFRTKEEALAGYNEYGLGWAGGRDCDPLQLALGLSGAVPSSPGVRVTGNELVQALVRDRYVDAKHVLLHILGKEVFKKWGYAQDVWLHNMLKRGPRKFSFFLGGSVDAVRNLSDEDSYRFVRGRAHTASKDCDGLFDLMLNAKEVAKRD